MSGILITGSDGSLGTALMKRTLGPATGMPGGVIRRGKDAIESFLGDQRFDTVINNYGINHLSWIGTTPTDDAEIFNINTLAPYWIVNHLVTRGNICRVVNVASATYRIPQRCTALYCASKAALVMLTKVMARELAPRGWVINAIAPGLIEDTEMNRKTTAQVLELRGWRADDADKYARALIPMGRYTDTAEVADAIFQVLALPDYINGTVIDMMGGA
jgi:NAD(P)-dependent dehydrogenase (short-subunit alcohol dehydrogenase family)